MPRARSHLIVAMPHLIATALTREVKPIPRPLSSPLQHGTTSTLSQAALTIVLAPLQIKASARAIQTDRNGRRAAQDDWTRRGKSQSRGCSALPVAGGPC
jgi:hypothetical protein